MATFALHVLALSVCMCFTDGVRLDGNGYHVVVAINKHVSEDPQIISEMQEALISASEYLYKTTRNYFFIKTVTILVPETWTKKPEWTPSSLTFREADIRVDSPHPSMGNNPYTFQHGLCGDEGRYIHLTPDFVLDKEGNRDWLYGDFGRLMVHEFAHFRYGVFDEYGSKESSQYPVYYLNGSTLRPTACSHDITGRFINMKTDKGCVRNNVGGKLLADDCAFIVNRYNNTAISSVMFAQFVEEVVHFCETNPTNPKLKHNADAPNKQNNMCNKRGTWDIIREHPDVKYSSPNIGQDTTPTFQVVQRQRKIINGTQVCGRRFVFVLDLSGSMTLNYRYFKLRQMADKIIRDILPVGTEVGIVVFSTTARVWAEMRYLKTESDRQTLAEGLPTLSQFGGGTAIGQGILKAIELLEENGQTASKGRVLLITDGGENVAPTVSSILPEIVKKNVVAHALAYSGAAADILQELSEQTSGQYSFFDESEESTDLDSTALRLLEDVSICESEDDSVEIHRNATVLDSTTPSYERTVLIDSTVGNSTLFVFTLSPNATTKVRITDPAGKVYDDNFLNYRKDTTLNIIRFYFPESERGSWKYILERGSNVTESVVGVVKSPRSPGSIKVESWVGNTTVDLGNGQGLAVYSYVHQGYAPVINAEVKLSLSGGGMQTLLDDGIYPDNTNDDGIYTIHVVGFKSDGRYSLDITVQSVAGQTAVLREGTSLSSRAPVTYPNATPPVVQEPVDPFTRTSSAGAVDVEGFDENVDQFDPSRVTDLEVVISDRGSRHVTLTWTAPGDDLNEGTVDRYDVRIAESFEDLRQNFSDSYEILYTDIKKGNNTPVPAGSQQTMTVSLPGHLDRDSYVFGLKAIDESNRTSDLSNLRAITFARIIIPGSTADTEETPEETPEETSPSMMLIIISVSVGFVVLVALVIIVICIVFRKRKVSKANNNPI